MVAYNKLRDISKFPYLCKNLNIRKYEQNRAKGNLLKFR